MILLLADDDEDDVLLTSEALKRANVDTPLHSVQDGVELMAYLRREGKYVRHKGDPLPALILLDLNMPRKGGLEVLDELREDEKLRRIPVCVFTTSSDTADLTRSYDGGANAYIRKPVSFDELVEAMKSISQFWLKTAELPTV